MVAIWPLFLAVDITIAWPLRHSAFGNSSNLSRRHDELPDPDSAAAGPTANSCSAINGCVPCRQISDSIRPLSDDGFAQAWFHADVAISCLESIDFRKDNAKATLDSIDQLIQFVPAQAYLKNPDFAKQHGFETYDLAAQLDAIRANIDKGAYDGTWDSLDPGGEYSFERHIAEAFYKANDSHLQWSGNLHEGIFQFRRPTNQALMMVESGDGTPSIYVRDEWYANPTGASPVQFINKKPVVDFLQEEAKSASIFDPNAAFNAMLWNTAVYSLGRFTRPVYVDDVQTVLTREDGTELVEDVVALPRNRADWVNVDGPKSAYESFVRHARTDPHVDAGDARAETAHYGWDQSRPSAFVDDTDVPTLPKNVQLFRRHSEWLASVPNAAYYMTLSGQKDSQVAILQFATFLDWSGESSAMVNDLIADCAKRQVSKIIIDFRQNQGGYNRLGGQFVAAFFPGQRPYDGVRFRSHPAVELIGHAYQQAPFHSVKDTFLDVTYARTPDGQPIDPDNFYQGETTDGDKFSATFGYDILRKSTLQPHFWGGDITLLTDGMCESICSYVFQYMTDIDPHIHVVTYGGTPTPGPMTPVGGTRGLEVINMRDIVNIMQDAKNVLSAKDPSLLAEFDTVQVKDTPIKPYRATFGAIDPLLNSQSTIPMQFQPVPSNCRLSPQAHHYFDFSGLYQDVYDLVWGKSSDDLGYIAQCVTGSVAPASKS